MENKSRIDKKHKILKILPIIIIGNMTGFAITLFLHGKLVSIPTDFPYSRGVWNAMGVAVIMLVMILVGFLLHFILNKVKNNTSNGNKDAI